MTRVQLASPYGELVVTGESGEELGRVTNGTHGDKLAQEQGGKPLVRFGDLVAPVPSHWLRNIAGGGGAR